VAELADGASGGLAGAAEGLAGGLGRLLDRLADLRADTRDSAAGRRPRAADRLSYLAAGAAARLTGAGGGRARRL
jgi:hypothetical protein